MPEIIVGHLFLATAAIELVFALVFAVRARQANLELPPERRSPAGYFVVAAAIVSAIGLCLFALFLPEARLRLI
jgi:hypothetical protein